MLVGEVQYPPVLAYHQVAAPGQKLSSEYPVIPRDELERQFRYLAEHGIRSLSMADYVEAISQAEPPRRAVLLTFDDGYRSLITDVLPLLEKYDLHAVAFVIAGQVGSRNRENPDQPWLSWEECRALQDSGRMDIEAHAYHGHTKVLGLRHGMLREGPFLTTRIYDPTTDAQESDAAYRRRIERELLLARTVIEDRLGKRVAGLAWPFGAANAQAMQAARTAGYQVTFTLDRSEFTELNRLRYHSPEHWQEVVQVLQGGSARPPGASFGQVSLRLRLFCLGLCLVGGAIVWAVFCRSIYGEPRSSAGSSGSVKL